MQAQTTRQYDPLADLAQVREEWLTFTASQLGVSLPDETFRAEFYLAWSMTDVERMAELTRRVVAHLRAHSFTYSSLLMTLN
jgi:hypothetical protein